MSTETTTDRREAQRTIRHLISSTEDKTNIALMGRSFEISKAMYGTENPTEIRQIASDAIAHSALQERQRAAVEAARRSLGTLIDALDELESIENQLAK